jgi:hypothetical protein
MNDNSYDVTISVWNDFHSPELCEGLSRNGFSVLALRSEKRPLENTETRHSETSRVLTRLFQRTQFPFLLEAAQNSFESFALRNLPESKVFWGWNTILSRLNLQKNALKKMFVNVGQLMLHGHSNG